AALDLALEVFGLLESVGRDREFGGYYEAVDRHWKGPLVQALSDVDIPCSKSMNTNLHILEAYTALYLATGQAKVAEALESLLQVFEKHILVSPSHLGLYFDRDWKNLTEQVSYGHDVEASWLMAEAAQALADHGSHPGHLDPVRAEVCLAIARTSLTILKENGGSMPEGIHNGRLDTTRTWWVQAEALVGMVNAWELSGDEAFLTAAESLWAYIDRFVVDRNRGDWHWAVDAQGRPDTTRPKGGLWKTSYHNGRACMEVISRMSRWS
ncbi:MAG TPA: AGE family epimerase/isomerase, partial [Spirochaetia bacterium]|nr:AGE family epimerase/isomerase [Spirochaetia bacterium]